MLPLNRRILLAISLALALRTAASSRVGLVSFDRLVIPHDIPAHLCSAIAQDHQGLLWFGTQGGLVRYDGYEFRLFESKASDPSSLAGNYVRTILVASDGRLWIGSFSGGLSVFDPATEKFTRLRHDSSNANSISYDRVEGLAESGDRRIWIATTAGLDRLDPRTNRIDHFRHDAKNSQSLADDRARGLLVDRSGHLWVGTRDGLQLWLGEGRGFERIGFAGEYVTKLYEDARGRIWVGTEEHGAAVLDPSTRVLHRFTPRPKDPNGLSHFWVYGFAEAVPGEMWVATFGGGIDVIDETSLEIVDRLRPDPLLPDTIPDDRIGAIFCDRGGVVWVGTWGEGVAWHDPRTRAFRTLRFSPNRPDGITHRSVVRAMETSDGTIWAGTNGNGIDILDRDLRRVGGYRPDAANRGALSDGGVTCLAQSDDGTIWVATLNSQLHRLRPGAAAFDRIPADRLPGGPIRSIAFARDGSLWAGAAEGMARVDPRALETTIFRQWPDAAKSSPAIESIVAAKDGTLWVGSDNGLYSFDPRTGKAIRIAHDAARRDSLPENWVPDLMLAHDGRLWVGTSGGAAILTKWDGVTARFAQVSTSPAEALIEDGRGHVWAGPRLVIDERSLASRVLGAADGIEFRNFFIASRARTRDGRLLFGSPEGLLIVDPAQLPATADETRLTATALRIDGKPRAGAPVLGSLTLSPRERSFAVDVAALDFTGAPRQYRYRLEGLDADWTLAGNSQRSITYSRLPPGHYTLRVGATARDGRWSRTELRLPVSVIPAFYQTLWFRVLAVLAAAAAIYGGYRLRVRQLQARQATLERIVAERTKELADAYARIEQASLTDPLTRLHNRRYLEQTIEADLELAARNGESLVVLLVDLDYFKSVNDTHGHAAGDGVLVELAEVLKGCVRASDVVVRWGGEEFLILVRFVNASVGPEIAEKVRATVAAHDFTLPDGTFLRRACSIGIAAWPVSPAAPHDVRFERVVDLADGALYEAKRRGRNCWVDASARKVAH